MARAGLGHVRLYGGDFHHLPYDDASVDVVFCIEAFCYATDLPRALAEVRRVLRPGGRFTLFDGYYTRPLAQMDADGALACELVARGMAMDTLQVQGDLLAAARNAGFVPAEPVALDTEVMPSLRRLESVTGAIIRWPWLGRRALARRLCHPPLDRGEARGRDRLHHLPGDRLARHARRQGSGDHRGR
jgi:SAM-dependent methyltransferase